MSYNEISKKNLRPIDNSSEAINNAKSRGKINASIKRNLLETLRTRIDEQNLIDDVVAGVVEEVQNGIYKNAIKLIDIAKEPEAQNINLNGGVEVQKVYIDKDTKEVYKKHIHDFINGTDK